MRVEYTRPASNEPDAPSDHPGNGAAHAGRDQESTPRPEDEEPAGDPRPTVG
jgi:hypothetical protein